MNEAEHRKQLLIQQIANHRELLSREIDVIRESNPVTPVIGSARRIMRGVVPWRRSRGGASGGAALAQLEAELVTTALPVVLRILRAVLSRRAAKRAAGK